MRLKTCLRLLAYGTSEGVRKEWDTRGRTGKYLYHGTDWASAKDIAVHGLDPARADALGHGGQRNYFGENRGNVVYTTSSKNAALGYGQSRNESKFAVVKILPDDDVSKRTKFDQESIDNLGEREGKKSFVTEGKIPSDKVAGVNFYTNYNGRVSVVHQWKNREAAK